MIRASKKFVYLIALSILTLTFTAKPSEALTPVDLALVLSVDISGSINDAEFGLQRQGYIDAFNDAALVSAIQGGNHGAIAVALVYWSTSQELAVDWMLINDATSAGNFATAIGNTVRPESTSIGTQTGIGSAITFSNSLFSNLVFTVGNTQEAFDPTKTIIDVSGDGEQNSGQSVTEARDNALAGDTDVINGLAIIDSFPDLLAYYEANVIGGTGSFAIEALNFNTFGAAIREKLILEIGGGPTDNGVVPEPSTFILLGSGMLAAFVRKRNRA